MYGLIGYPLGHSFSADFFNSKFKSEGIDEEYRLFPIQSVEYISTILKEHKDLKGLNVTIPYKEKIIPYLTDISEDAKRIGAVNVIKISDNGKTLKGFNSDAIGFRNSISPLLKPHMKKALVLGTGGAARAVCHVLRELGIHVTQVSRNPVNGEISYNDISPDIMSSHNVIVNTTPLGMWPDIEKAPDIPYNLLTPLHLCYDLIYNPDETKFMKESKRNGAFVKNGLEMLHGQAVAAWEIWSE